MSSLCLLPSEVFISILEYVKDDKALLRSRLVSVGWKYLVDDDRLWIRKFRRLRHAPNWPADSIQYSWKERYFRAKKWLKSAVVAEQMLDMKHKYIPWIQLSPLDGGGSSSLWLSRGARLDRVPIDSSSPPTNPASSKNNKRARSVVILDTVEGRSKGDDFCRFVVVARGGGSSSSCWLAAGTRSGLLYLFRRYDHQQEGHHWRRHCSIQAHSSDLHCIDLLLPDHHSPPLVVSGSRDRTVKVWRLGDDDQDQDQGRLLHTLSLGDRAWCLQASRSSSLLAVGSAACWNECPPVTLWDVERGVQTGQLGTPCRRGAGVLDLSLVGDDRGLLCGGYDSVARLWDLRTGGGGRCAWSFEEPYNSVFYCLASDGDRTAFLGTSRYGLVWLVDTRWPRPVQNYYVGSGNRPVYSLAADTGRLYVGLDTELVALKNTH